MTTITQIIRDTIADKIRENTPDTLTNQITYLKSTSPLTRQINELSQHTLSKIRTIPQQLWEEPTQTLWIYYRQRSLLKICILPEDIIIITEDQYICHTIQVISLHQQDSIDKAIQTATTIFENLAKQNQRTNPPCHNKQ